MRSHRWLVRAFPRAWRARYGPELEDLLADMGSDGPVSWRDRLDVAAAGTTEHLHRLRGSPRARRAAVACVLTLGVAAVVAAAAVHAGTRVQSAHSLARSGTRAGQSPGTPRPPAPPSGAFGLVRPLPGPIHLTVHGPGARETYRGTCGASGECALMPATGGTLGTVVVTLDPTTGAVLAVRGATLPAGTGAMRWDRWACRRP